MRGWVLEPDRQVVHFLDKHCAFGVLSDLPLHPTRQQEVFVANCFRWDQAGAKLVLFTSQTEMDGAGGKELRALHGHAALKRSGNKIILRKQFV